MAETLREKMDRAANRAVAAADGYHRTLTADENTMVVLENGDQVPSMAMRVKARIDQFGTSLAMAVGVCQEAAGTATQKAAEAAASV